MNKRKTLIGAGVIAAAVAGGSVVAPGVRETEIAYLFDYDQKGITIMIPKCEATHERDGCAANMAEALAKAQYRAAKLYYNLSTDRP